MSARIEADMYQQRTTCRCDDCVRWRKENNKPEPPADDDDADDDDDTGSPHAAKAPA